MMRCKELEEYIQEYCSERRKIKWEYLDKHYSMLFPAFVENLDILINVFWQIRYTRPGKTGAIARNMESGYQVQSWADQALQQKPPKNRSIRIIPIESKWSTPSA